MTIKKLVKFAGVTLAAASILAACSSGGSKATNSAEAEKVLTVGIMTKNDNTEARWNAIEKNLEAEGISLKFVEFTDYSQPNPALSNGELDVNAFQHYNFLDNYNNETGSDLVAVAETVISPIHLFSGTDGEGGKAKYTDFSELPEGATISVPNDPTNESRALFVLEAIGLITLEEGVELATIADIKENPKNITVKEIDASQTVSSLPSVDAAVINNNYALDAGIDYATSLYKEDASNESAKKWINVIAAQSDWESSDKADLIKALVKAYHTDEVKQIVDEASNGIDVAVW